MLTNILNVRISPRLLFFCALVISVNYYLLSSKSFTGLLKSTFTTKNLTWTIGPEIATSVIQNNTTSGTGKFASTIENSTAAIVNNFANQSELFYKMYKTNSSKINGFKLACNLTQLDPFDPSIKKYIKPPEAVNCSNNPKFPRLFTTDLRSTIIQINDPASYGFYHCCWNSFQRKHGSDRHVILSDQCVPIIANATSIPEDVDFVEISCDFLNKSEIVSGKSLIVSRQVVDIFGLMHLNPSVEKRIEKELASNTLLQQSSQRNLSVVIFGLDAVSHMNFIRNFPLTFNYLTKNLSSPGISGLNKVADNTFPNLVALLTGLYVDELREKTDCWKQNTDYFDECPFIWKEFSRHGFRTAYGEDGVEIGNFNFGGNQGFNKQPTDYYITNMAYQQSKKIGHHYERRNAKICYGPKFSFQVLLDFLKQMALIMNPNRRYFQFVWSTALTHDNLMDGSMVDIYLVEAIKFFHNQGFLENTAFILMSDHGIRWGGIVETPQGKIEERMPFAYFILPEWFKQEYPQAIENLISNEHKLTTHFDIHETLLDLLFLYNLDSKEFNWRQYLLNSHFEENSAYNSSSKSTLNSRLPRGISLFLAIPPERTCADADIVDQWCVCKSVLIIDAKNNSLVDEAARNVVHFINGLLLKYPQCEDFHYVEALTAQLQMTEDAHEFWKGINNTTDSRLQRKKLIMNVSLKVAPSNATFDATATRQINGEWEVSKEIARTNAYGKQGWCIAPSKLEKYCFCEKAYDVKKEVDVVQK